MKLLKLFLNFLTRTVFFFFLIIFLHTFPSYAETLTIGTGEWCPYICDPNIHNGLEGYLADVASIVFKKAGYKTQLKKLPLERASMMCRKGKIDGLLAIYREDAPDLIFPKKEQIINTEIFLTRKGNPWKYTGMQSLNQIKKLGLVKDYTYPIIKPFIKKYPEKVVMVKDKDAVQQRLKLMLRDRIDVVMDNRDVLRYTIRKMKLTEQFTEAGVLGKSMTSLYNAFLPVAFSPVNPESKKYAEIFVTGTEELRKSGELDKIMNKYGLQDWKK
ncbi:MAG: amino acid ABC transporter substrate-binding protein [Desulfobacterales bacterium]|nr:amino acid ABC transporter substrate-binding protein [Desulfobacterales bacterium]